jgi:hypothetical protein
MIRADLCCYHCGYVAGTVEGDRERPLVEARLIPASTGPGLRLSPGRPPRCGRCGGPLYLDELSMLHILGDDEVAADEELTEPVPA